MGEDNMNTPYATETQNITYESETNYEQFELDYARFKAQEEIDETQKEINLLYNENNDSSRKTGRVHFSDNLDAAVYNNTSYEMFNYNNKKILNLEANIKSLNEALTNNKDQELVAIYCRVFKIKLIDEAEPSLVKISPSIYSKSNNVNDYYDVCTIKSKLGQALINAKPNDLLSYPSEAYKNLIINVKVIDVIKQKID